MKSNLTLQAQWLMLAQQVLPEAGQQKMLPLRRLGGSQAPNYVLSITGNTLIREAVLCAKHCPVFCSSIQVLLKIQASLGGEARGWRISKSKWKTSPMVQWLILCASLQAWLWSLVREVLHAAWCSQKKSKSIHQFLCSFTGQVAGMQKLRVWGGLEGWEKRECKLIPPPTPPSSLTSCLPHTRKRQRRVKPSRQLARQVYDFQMPRVRYL